MKEELSALVGWRLVYSIKCWQQKDRRSKRYLASHLLEARFGTIQVFFSFCPGDIWWTQSPGSLVSWSREERDPGASGSNANETVTRYCLSKWWLVWKKQDWWSQSRGPLKQVFELYTTEAYKTGLTHRKYEDLKMCVHGVNCVAVGEKDLDHVRARQDKGRDQQTEVFGRVCRLAREVNKHVVIHCRGTTCTATFRMTKWCTGTISMIRKKWPGRWRLPYPMLCLVFLRRSWRSNLSIEYHDISTMQFLVYMYLTFDKWVS